MASQGPALAWDSAGIGAELLRRSREEERRAAYRRKPLEPGETIDPNRADELTLDRLPGVGEGTARAIVEARESLGGFETVEELLRVRGIGPATLDRIRGRLDLSRGVPVALARTRADSNARSPHPNAPAPAPPAAPLDINEASTTQLEALPGVGPALARRIVEARARLGGFRTVEDLIDVRGIGPATLDRLKPLVRVRRARRR